MSTFFPFLRGKQSELLALRELSSRIAEARTVLPIIEPVNGNSTTKISLDNYVQNGMAFGLIVNPNHGAYAGRESSLYSEIIQPALEDYENYFPVLQVSRDTRIAEVNWFNGLFGHLWRGVIYNAEPPDQRIIDWVKADAGVYHHVFIEGNVSTDFINQFAPARRVLIRDNFKKQVRNSDYPPQEFFTDLNTDIGNPDTISWGDYSIQGNNYSETGGPAYAVAIHHIHESETGKHLEISHVLSNRQDTDADTPGKIIEAVQNLVTKLERLSPKNTSACDEYRAMAESGISKGLPYLKRLGIRHHLELMLS